jgi:hypothetical protein
MSGYHYVRPYRRRNGTYVRGHVRRNPTRPIGVLGVIFFAAFIAWLGGMAHGQADGTSPTNVPTAVHSYISTPKPESYATVQPSSKGGR